MLFLPFVIAGGIVGATLGAESGAKLLGLPGGILGFLVGGYLGLWIGRLPYDLSMMWTLRSGRKSLDDSVPCCRHPTPTSPIVCSWSWSGAGRTSSSISPWS